MSRAESVHVQALKRLGAVVRSWGPMAEVIVQHAGAVNLAETLAGMLRAQMPERQIMIGPAGSVLPAHLDLGL